MKYKQGDKIEFQGCIFLVKKCSKTQYLLEYDRVVNLATAFDHLMYGWEFFDFVDSRSTISN
jgi:hypothetical protein